MIELTGIKRILKTQSYLSNVAYVYRDGVILKVEEKTKSGAKGEVYHVWRGSVSLPSDVKRLVIHRPEMIMHGIDHIEIYMGSGSENTKKAGLSVTSVYIYDPDGALVTDHQIDRMLSGYITVQPNPNDDYTSYDVLDSVDKAFGYGYTVVEHTKRQVQ